MSIFPSSLSAGSGKVTAGCPLGVTIAVLVVKGMKASSFWRHWPKARSAVRRVLEPILNVPPTDSVVALLSGGREVRPNTGLSTAGVMRNGLSKMNESKVFVKSLKLMPARTDPQSPLVGRVHAEVLGDVAQRLGRLDHVVEAEGGAVGGPGAGAALVEVGHPDVEAALAGGEVQRQASAVPLQPQVDVGRGGVQPRLHQRAQERVAGVVPRGDDRVLVAGLGGVGDPPLVLEHRRQQALASVAEVVGDAGVGAGEPEPVVFQLQPVLLVTLGDVPPLQVVAEVALLPLEPEAPAGPCPGGCRDTRGTSTSWCRSPSAARPA